MHLGTEPRASVLPISRVVSREVERPMANILQENMIFCIITLMAIGFFMVMNATAGRGGEGPFMHYYSMKQFTWDLFSLGCFIFVISAVSVERLRKYALVMFVVSLILLLGVFLFGQEINGAKRWFRFGFIGFQPSELAKICSIIFFAHFLDKNKERVQEFCKGLLPCVVIIMVTVGLIAVEPDLGNAGLLLFVLVAMVFIAGARLIHLFYFFAGLFPIAILFLYQHAHFRSRMEVFFYPEDHLTTKGYQAQQALIALGSGGVGGKGLGQGLQKLFYLPEAHNDFIFAIIGEDFGFIGCAVVVLIYGLLVWYAIQISLNSPNMFVLLLSFGLTTIFACQALFNLGVVTRMVPNKGISLPLISYGGSSVLFTMLSLGILVSLAKSLPPESPKELGAIRLKKRKPLF